MSAVQPVENVPTDESEASPVAEEDPTEQHEPAQEEDSPLPQSDTLVTAEGLTALVTTACAKWKDKGQQKLDCLLKMLGETDGAVTYEKFLTPDRFRQYCDGETLRVRNQGQRNVTSPDLHSFPEVTLMLASLERMLKN